MNNKIPHPTHTHNRLLKTQISNSKLVNCAAIYTLNLFNDLCFSIFKEGIFQTMEYIEADTQAIKELACSKKFN